MSLSELDLHSGAADLLLDYLQAQHLNDAALRDRLTTYSRSSRMTHAQWWDALNTVQRLLPQRQVGLEIGLGIKPAHLGVLGYLMLTSASLAEALQRAQRFMALLHQSDTVVIDFHDGDMRVRWTTQYGNAPQLSDEVYFSAILQFLRTCTGRDDLTYNRLHFTFPEPADISAHTKLFRCPLAFGQPCSEILLPLTVFTLALNHADPTLSDMLEQQAAALMTALPQPGEFTVRLREVLMRSLQSGDATADNVARQLALSRRTLHRRLSEHGLDFSTVLQRVREQLARQYLGEVGLSLTEITLLLGYAEQSAFTRAFKQWTGETPLRFRQKNIA